MDSTPNDTQQALLDRLEALFLDEGFASFTVGELASRLACSKRALYELAPSKSELLARVVERNLAQRYARSLAGLDSEQSPLDRLLLFLNGIAVRNDREREQYRRDMIAHPATNELRLQHMERMLQLLEAIVHDGINQGVFRQNNPDVITAFAMALMQTTANPELAVRLDTDYPTLFEQGVEFLLRGVLVR